MAATTGSALLPDIGKLSYNGVSFNSLYSSSVSSAAIPDNANRTTKFVAHSLTVEAMVTLDDDQHDQTIDRIMGILRQKLEATGGQLIYTGKGFGSPLVINAPGSGGLRDVAWGPIPKLMEFVPLGGSRSARIRWTVVTCVAEIAKGQLGVLQFNEDIEISYDEEGFSQVGIKGVLEIPLTRPTQDSRILTKTVDDYRQKFMAQIAQNFDLTRFRVTGRGFTVSRDRRTLDWNFRLDELPTMGLPGGITVAHGSIQTKPLKGRTLGSTVLWISSMRSTYTVPKGTPRRLAWLAFLSLWNFRMRQSEFGGTVQQINAGGIPTGQFVAGQNVSVNVSSAASLAYNNRYNQTVANIINATGNISANVMNIFNRVINALPRIDTENNSSLPLSLEINEGLYLDSKDITFIGTWRFQCRFSHLLLATGLWRPVGNEGGNFWAQSVQNISGGKSWLENKVNPAGDVIVDFGL